MALYLVKSLVYVKLLKQNPIGSALIMFSFFEFTG